MVRNYPRISLLEVPQHRQEPNFMDEETPVAKTVLQQSEKDLKTLKIPELVKILSEITGHQPRLPKKPRKADLLSKILDIAMPRQN